MDRENVLATVEGRTEKHIGRRITWHLVGAAVALFVGFVSLSIAWAGATVNYQARVEREQLHMLAKPQTPSPTDSSFASYPVGAIDGVYFP